MFELAYILAIFGGFCLLLGVVYPAVAIIFYPVYRRLGGRDSFTDYVRSL